MQGKVRWVAYLEAALVLLGIAHVATQRVEARAQDDELQHQHQTKASTKSRRSSRVREKAGLHSPLGGICQLTRERPSNGSYRPQAKLRWEALRRSRTTHTLRCEQLAAPPLSYGI